MSKIIGRRRRGQALVEFALVFPLVLLLIFVAIQVLQIGIAQSILSAAAGEAARSASVHEDIGDLNTLLSGSNIGLRTRAQAVEAVVNARVRHTLPMLANTTAQLDAEYKDVDVDGKTYHVAIEDVVTLQTDVQVLPFIPITKLTIKATGRAFRNNWVDAIPMPWVPDGSCYLGASVNPPEPKIGADTLVLNINAADKDGNPVDVQADVTWNMNGSVSDSCPGSGSFSCNGPVAAAPDIPQAYAKVILTSSSCDKGNQFVLKLPFFPHP